MPTTNRTNVAETNRHLQTALKTGPDYSEAFTTRVALLADGFRKTLSLPVEHDTDMNYRAAQKIGVWLNEACAPVEPRSGEAIYQMNTYVSSKGRYFTFVTLKLSDSGNNGRARGLERLGRFWVRLDEDTIPAGIANLQKVITLLMQPMGYSFLPGSLLSREAKGHSTDLDGKPATLFEALFSELD